jgi:holliday junction DNA helicase RuvB
MPREALLTAPPPEDDRTRDAALRPRFLREVIGQQKVSDRLRVAVAAAKKLKEPIGHILFDGPPGLGKTTFATVLPNELNCTLQTTSGPALSKPADLLPFLTNIEENGILFIDEIHRLPRVVEEFIYPAMEDFRIDIVLGEGVNARTINMKLKRFTLIGATTRSGMLSGPMRDRFKMQEHLEYYTPEELSKIVAVNARKLNLGMESEACAELARRSRGTPRVANSRLYWVRSFHAAHAAEGPVSLDLARRALEMQEVDRDGLDRQDRRYLETLVDVFGGGPTGESALASTMNLSSDTLTDEVEPYLLREGYIIRSPRGRIATAKGFAAIGRGAPPPAATSGGLFDPLP